MTLLQAKRGRPVRIIEIPDERARAQCVRFGIGEGTVVDYAETLMAGPVLLRHHNQEICVGRRLASNILVEVDPDGSVARDDGRSGSGGPGRGHRRRWFRRGRHA